MTILVGIDVAKDKHDCFIMNSEGEVLANPFTILNNKEGFDFLYEKIKSISSSDKIKVGLEATGHYSYNIIGFLLNKGLATLFLTHSTQIFTEKVLALERRKRIRLILKPLSLIHISEPTRP